jgi:hypothetical protein
MICLPEGRGRLGAKNKAALTAEIKVKSILTRPRIRAKFRPKPRPPTENDSPDRTLPGRENQDKNEKIRPARLDVHIDPDTSGRLRNDQSAKHAPQRCRTTAGRTDCKTQEGQKMKTRREAHFLHVIRCCALMRCVFVARWSVCYRPKLSGSCVY